MALSYRDVIILIVLICVSKFIRDMRNVITVNPKEDDALSIKNNTIWKSVQKNVKIGNSKDHVIWFMQVTDLHISKYHDKSRQKEFHDFCTKTVNTIKPTLVLITGDLTDAKTENTVGSKQQIYEWESYRRILIDTKVAQNTMWLEIRGNHDNFNIVGLDSEANYYHRYSLQGTSNPYSYMHIINHRGDKYAFIGVDACLNPGPRRPFNFLGMLSRKEMTNIINLSQKAIEQQVNYTIWFGHYPTSCILTPNPGIRKVLGSNVAALAYLCGHLHSMASISPSMYTLQKAGFLELELSDWKDERKIRLAAIDHGMFSFVDLRHNKWPLILITNPKDALFMIPTRENVTKILESTHIRVLIFSPSKIVEANVKIDKGEWQPLNHVDGPLYVASWEPTLYRKGIHNIQVTVTDADGSKKTIKQPFALDGTKLSYRFVSKFLLMGNTSHIFQFMFSGMLLLCIIPICTLRIMHKLTKIGKINKPNIKSTVLRLWIRKIWVLSTIDRIFYPLVLYSLYFSVGPWLVGELIEGKIGVIFAWGIYLNGTFLPGSFTYFYGFVQMACCQLPLTFILANCVDKRLQIQMNATLNKPKSFINLVCYHTPFFLCISSQIFFAYYFLLSYGTIGCILGPLRTWCIVFSIVLWYQAINLPEKCTRNAALVWSVKTDEATITSTLDSS